MRKRNNKLSNLSRTIAFLSGAAALCLPLNTAADSTDSTLPFDVNEVTAIIGGQPSPFGNFPSTVALLQASNSGSLYQKQFCGGAAISDSYILTAAHCMFNADTPMPAASIRIAGNFVDLLNDSPAEIQVAEIILHPDYQASSAVAENDIALLRLEQPHNIPPVQLFNGDAEKLASVTAAIAGWGLLNPDPNVAGAFPTVLHEAYVPIVSRATCNAVYGNLLSEVHLCAGFQQGGIDACSGDSGGPLMIQGDNDTILQAGVTSFGNGCALPNAYGVYANVENYEEWIKSIVPAPSSGAPLFASPAAYSSASGGGVLGGVNPSPSPSTGDGKPDPTPLPTPSPGINSPSAPMGGGTSSGSSGGAIGGSLILLLAGVGFTRRAARHRSNQ